MLESTFSNGLMFGRGLRLNRSDYFNDRLHGAMHRSSIQPKPRQQIDRHGVIRPAASLAVSSKCCDCDFEISHITYLSVGNGANDAAFKGDRNAYNRSYYRACTCRL